VNKIIQARKQARMRKMGKRSFAREGTVLRLGNIGHACLFKVLGKSQSIFLLLLGFCEVDLSIFKGPNSRIQAQVRG
jgi:hypothetical protein